MSELLRVRELVTDFQAKGGLFSGKRTVHAVRGVSFDLEKGEVLGLVGESGCGKSTLGRSILQLIRPTGGSVRFHDKELTSLPGEELRMMRRSMQLIFQDPYASLNPRMNVKELIRAPLDVFRIGTPEERDRKVVDMMEKVGMGAHQMNRYPHEFSGGQRQRIGIARALILEPEFVVCDEPVSALDVSVRASVLNLLKDLRKEMDLTLLFISHDLSVVKHISDRVAVMYLGSIVELTVKKEIYSNAMHPYTKALLDAIPPSDSDEKKELKPLEGNVPSPFEILPGCSFQGRCLFCTERCRMEQPILQEVEEGHFVACHLYHSGSEKFRKKNRIE